MIQNSTNVKPFTPNNTKSKRVVTARLKELGADWYDLLLPETRSLAQFIETGEELDGVVYGHYRFNNGRPPGRGLLVATSRRIIFIDHKPLFLNADEISYVVISGVSQGSAAFSSTVTINTRLGDISVRTFNLISATSFVQAIEDHIFEEPANFRPIRPTDASSRI